MWHRMLSETAADRKAGEGNKVLPRKTEWALDSTKCGHEGCRHRWLWKMLPSSLLAATLLLA